MNCQNHKNLHLQLFFIFLQPVYLFLMQKMSFFFTYFPVISRFNKAIGTFFVERESYTACNIFTEYNTAFCRNFCVVASAVFC